VDSKHDYPFRIEGVSDELFGTLIDFVYEGYNSASLADIADHQGMLSLASQFEMFGLKTAMEIELTKSRDKGNVIDLASFADAHSCALFLQSTILPRTLPN